MTKQQLLARIKEYGVKPGDMVRVQWFLDQSGAITALQGLVADGFLAPLGPPVSGVQETYTLLKPIP